MQDRSNLQSLLVAANQRIEFLDQDVVGLRNMLEKERTAAAAK
jgi:hypothetical protein